MFLLDEKIATSRDYMRVADTCRVYEAVLEKYGYTREEYLASQEKYLKDPERYSRILKKTVHILEAENKALKAEKQRRDALAEAERGVKRFAPDFIRYMSGLANPSASLLDSVRYFVDSLESVWTFDPQKGMDTVYAGPAFTVTVPDTLHKMEKLKTDIKDELTTKVRLQNKPRRD